MANKLVMSAVAALAMLATFTGVHAQTLDQALLDAWQSNPRIGAAQASASSAAHALRATQGGWYPQLGLTGRIARDRVNGQIALGPVQQDISGHLNQRSIGLRLEQAIWQGGQLAAQVTAAKRTADATQATAHARTATVLLHAVQAYLDVVAAHKLLQVEKKNVTVIRQQAQAARFALKHGEGTSTDVAQASARLQQAIARRIRVAAQLARLRALYATVIGHPPGELRMPTTLPALPATLTQAVALAGGNYQVQAAQLQAQAAAAHAQGVSSALLPDIGLYVEVRHSHEPQYGFRELDDAVIGINLSMPIWNGGSLRAHSAAAQDQAKAARLQAQSRQDHARSRVVAAWQTFAATQSALVAIESQLAAAKVAYAGVKAQHRQGTRTLLDALDAEQAVRDAHAAMIRAHRNRIVAAYTLLAATGGLTVQSLGLQQQPTGTTG